jgi:enoyl-CoA hydratase
MNDGQRAGEVRYDSEGHIFKIIIDNVAKRNAFTPAMMRQCSIDRRSRYLG